MVALQSSVVRENLRRREAKCISAQRTVSPVICEQNRRESDAVTRVRPAAHLSHFEVPAVRLQPPDLLTHCPSKLLLARAETHDHGLRVLREQRAPPPLQTLFH